MEVPRNGKLKSFILSWVSVLWGIGFFMDIVSDNFVVPTEVHALMGIVVGYFVGSKFTKNNK